MQTLTEKKSMRTVGVKKAIEKSFGGRPFHALMELGAKLPGCDDPGPGDGPGASPIRRKFLGLRYRIGYECNFANLNLKKAYEYRFRHFVAVALGAASGDPMGARRYLELMNDEAMLSGFELDAYTRDFIRGLSGNLGPEFFGKSEGRKKAGRAVMCGPGADLAKIDFSRYDFAVFNKPTPKLAGLEPAKTILVLNNQWPTEKPKELLAWVAGNEGATLISPIAVGDKVVKNAVFERIPRFLLGASLMGLQRTLFVLNHEFEMDSLDVAGFDFSLSRNPYNAWYPSLIAKNYGTLDRGIVLSSMTHDLLLNLRYTRGFIEANPWVSGEIVEISSRTPGRIFSQFKEIYSTRS